MQSEFYRFYQLSESQGGRNLDWKKLQQYFRVKEKRYPSNQQILEYFLDTFTVNTTATERSKWHKMDKLLFIWVVAKHCELRGRNIMKIELQDFENFSNILGVPERLLEIKWVKLAKPYLKKVPWDKREDSKILKLMQTELCGKWTEITLYLFQKGYSKVLRTAKQVRERWVNYIDPTIRREDWSQEEDIELMDLVHRFGKRWSELGKYLKRSENSIKNRFFSLNLLKKKMKKQYESPDGPSPEPTNMTLEGSDNQTSQKSDQDPTFDSSKVCGFRLIQPGETFNPIQII